MKQGAGDKVWELPVGPNDLTMSRSAFWQQAWDDAQPRIEEIRRSLKSVRPSTLPALRLGQLDAEILDQELLQILKVPLEKALGVIYVRQSQYH